MLNKNYRYLLFNKPYGVLCQFTDNTENPRPTLKDYIPVPDVYSVGRLDRDSEGLLFLTNNGLLKHRLSHRQFAHPRTYLVQVERIPDETTLNQLRQGVAIKDYKTRPAKVKLLKSPPAIPPRDPPIRYRKTVPTAWLAMTLTEGRNRQVRRMTAAVGYPTLRLIRTAIGVQTQGKITNLTLEGLNPGQWRELTPSELIIFKGWTGS
ncbi:probable pseudouridine synthase [Crocosphaera subtropica ATCC 51142]|uniref:Pseudouridine synthase n=1 Tax=Crocosphaera subtropica (strain ATCC 51142 / BH68) TaxID=43989 RepID=B1WWD0_CROS5|nr:pseudouridine synthase [Crocosphaera subtropica]ACB54058.1 probable pseudouridine synthase [Crocosphaera subtropica ATCC 51142]